jgi:hypothetical protein
MTDTNQQMSSVGVFVDGQRLYSVAAESFTVFINSCEWPNGPHEIYATVTTVDGGETLPDSDEATATNAANFAVGVSSSQFVTFSNYISQFFVAVPFFDPSVGQTQEVVATFPEDTYWRLTVLDYQNSPVRQFTGQGSSLYAAWDGNDDSGNPLSDGYYDYYIEARPSQYGGLSSMVSSTMNAALSDSRSTSVATAAANSAVFAPTPAAIQFPARSGGVSENVQIPSLNPTPPIDAVASASLAASVKSSRVISYDGTNELINGVPAFLYPPEIQPSEWQLENSTLNALIGDFSPMDSSSDASWPDAVYTTQTPNRVPGNLFKHFAGTVGIGFQGHHPSSPNFGLPPGEVISASHPPYGPLKTASAIANGFSIDMGLYGWRTSFYLGDDNLNSTNLFPIDGPGSLGKTAFAAKCDLGLLVGHMTATAYTDPDYYVTHSYYPVYNTKQPGAYQWIPLPGMDFGKYDGSSPLKWMALYGCNSLRYQDIDDMWTHYTLPLPPNLRLMLGSEEGVFIHPSFGYRFAIDLNSSMSVVDAWCEAASYADQQTAKSLKWRFLMGTRNMTYIYRDDTQEGSWRTISDSIWSWSGDISYDWYDITYQTRQVYPTQ